MRGRDAAAASSNAILRYASIASRATTSFDQSFRIAVSGARSQWSDALTCVATTRRGGERTPRRDRGWTSLFSTNLHSRYEALALVGTTRCRQASQKWSKPYLLQ